MSFRGYLLGLMLAFWCTAALSQEVVIKTGFVTGNQYRVFSATEKQKYAIGLLDGIFLSPFYGADKKKLEEVEQCVTDMSDGQVAAIFDKYISENPGRWHESMNVLAYVALLRACGL